MQNFRRRGSDSAHQSARHRLLEARRPRDCRQEEQHRKQFGTKQSPAAERPEKSEAEGDREEADRHQGELEMPHLLRREFRANTVAPKARARSETIGQPSMTT